MPRSRSNEMLAAIDAEAKKTVDALSRVPGIEELLSPDEVGAIIAKIMLTAGGPGLVHDMADWIREGRPGGVPDFHEFDPCI